MDKFKGAPSYQSVMIPVVAEKPLLLLWTCPVTKVSNSI